MAALLYFLFAAILILVMMRFCFGSYIMGRIQHYGPKTAVDPVCGMTVETDKAELRAHQGTFYFFCSRECRDRFLAAPQLYIGPKVQQTPEQMEHSHE